MDGLDVSIILNGWIKSNPLTIFFVWWMDLMDIMVDGLDGYGFDGSYYHPRREYGFLNPQLILRVPPHPTNKDK